MREISLSVIEAILRKRFISCVGCREGLIGRGSFTADDEEGCEGAARGGHGCLRDYEDG